MYHKTNDYSQPFFLMPTPDKKDYPYSFSLALSQGNSSITNNTVSVENVTCDENTPYIADEGGCAISRQPCYYTAIVEAVYKGNIQVCKQ